MKCVEVHPKLAAFVLGGLEPGEAAEVESQEKTVHGYYVRPPFLEQAALREGTKGVAEALTGQPGRR